MQLVLRYTANLQQKVTPRRVLEDAVDTNTARKFVSRDIRHTIVYKIKWNHNQYANAESPSGKPEHHIDGRPPYPTYEGSFQMGNRPIILLRTLHKSLLCLLAAASVPH